MSSPKRRMPPERGITEGTAEIELASRISPDTNSSGRHDEASLSGVDRHGNPQRQVDVEAQIRSAAAIATSPQPQVEGYPEGTFGRWIVTRDAVRPQASRAGTGRRWSLRPDLRLLSYDEAVELGLLDAEQMAVSP